MEWYLIVQHFSQEGPNVSAIEFETEELAQEAEKKLLAAGYLHSFVTRRAHSPKREDYESLPFQHYAVRTVPLEASTTLCCYGD